MMTMSDGADALPLTTSHSHPRADRQIPAHARAPPARDQLRPKRHWDFAVFAPASLPELLPLRCALNFFAKDREVAEEESILRPDVLFHSRDYPHTVS
jgi:hypothetical protein